MVSTCSLGVAHGRGRSSFWRFGEGPVRLPVEGAFVFDGARFGFAVGEGVVEVADGGGVVVGHLDEGEDVAVGFVEGAHDL